MSKKYENINNLDREALESIVTKMTQDAYHKGFNKGMQSAKEIIIGLFEQSDSACSDWAVAVITGKSK